MVRSKKTQDELCLGLTRPRICTGIQSRSLVIKTIDIVMKAIKIGRLRELNPGPLPP